MRNVAVRQVTETPTSVSSSASPASTPSAVLIINTPNQMTTCQSGNISWNYSSLASAELTLKLTDVNVNQSGATTPPPNITQTLESNIDVASGSWTWQQVNVSSGYYVVEGSVNDDSTQSEAFFVANGSDTSCILSQSSPSTTTPSIASPSTAKRINIGAIVGGIIGGVVIIAAILALLLFCKSKRPSRSSRRPNNVRWAKFPSTDSQDPFATGKFSGNKNSGQWSSSDERRSKESIGSKLDIVAVVPSTDLFDDHEKEASPSSTKSNTLASVTPMSYDNRQISASSASQPPNYSRPRVHSTRNPARNSADAIPFNVHLDSRQHSSLDILDPRVDRSSIPSMPPSTYYPHKSSSEMIPLGRSASSRSTSVRRTSRKPVPRYDASELEGHPHSNNTDLPPFDLGLGPVPNLSHKSSSGDVRPVHYLIPDMPPHNKA